MRHFPGPPPAPHLLHLPSIVATLLVLALLTSSPHHRASASSPPSSHAWTSLLQHIPSLTSASTSDPKLHRRSLRSSPNEVRPKIFIYDFPAFRENADAYTWVNTSLYGLEITFPDYLIDSPYRTLNPEEADYFYVWAWLYNSKMRDISALLAELKKQPYWERNGGRDHIITIVHDQGLCDYSHGDFKRFHDFFSTAIIMEHWGKPTGVFPDNPCRITEGWASNCDQVFKMVETSAGVSSYNSAAAAVKGKGGFSKVNPVQASEPVPCYTAGKDLLVPTVTSEKPETTRYLEPKLNSLDQSTLIIFGGGINKTHLTDPDKPENDAGYSFGVRQTFARLYHNHPEVKIFYDMVPDYWEHFHRSTFCLAPAGWGWGARVKSAITRGCIPVIIQDGIKVEWEDELPMHLFAIRMPFMHLHRLPEILHRFKRLGRVPAMQKALSCVWRLYWWTRPHGRAFEMTICTLKSRLLGRRLELDLHTCTLKCGDDKLVDFNKEINSV